MDKLHFARRRWYLFPPLIIVALAGFSLLFMLLWNAIIPQVFHLSPITYLQAIGLLVISRLLFGGFHCKPWHNHGHWGPFHDKLKNMTPEERVEFYKNWRKHQHGCCGDVENSDSNSGNDSK